MACHSDHPRPRLTKASSVRFDHALLKADARANCQSCHMAPRDELHRGQALACATCHQPAHWKPATFDHSRYFLLDRDHNTACTTCHLDRSEEQTSELQSLMRISYAVFCLKKKKNQCDNTTNRIN